VQGWRALRSGDPDVIIGDHAGVTSFVAAVLSALYGTPFVLRLGGDIWKINRQKFAEHLADREWRALVIISITIVMNEVTFRLTNGYLAISETVEQAIIKNTNTSRDKIGIIGVPVDRAQFESGNGGVVREELGLTDERVLLTVVNLRFKGKFEGVRASLEEIGGILREDEDTVYIIAGGGDYYSKLRELIEDEFEDEIADRIYCVGHVDDIENYYHLAEVMIYVSFNEGFGNIIQEAQIAGCPVVANNAYGMSDQLIHEETGILVDIETSGELKESVQHLLDNDKLYRYICRCAREHVLEVSNPTKIGQQMISNIDNLLE